MNHRLQVWVSSIAGPEEWLTTIERERLSRFRSAATARDFLVGTTLARFALGAWLGVPEAEVPLERTCERCGAPHGRPRAPGVYLSIAHADGTALVALSDAPVGIDLEPIGHDVPAACGAHDLADWVRKEAVLKLVGTGLRTPMNLIELDHGRVTRWPDVPLPDIVIRDLEVPGFQVSLAGSPEALNRPLRVVRAPQLNRDSRLRETSRALC